MTATGFNSAERGQSLLLDFSYPLGQDEDNEYDRNYQQYNVFATRRYVQQVVNTLNLKPQPRVDILPQPWRGRMHMCIELYVGRDFMPLPPRARELIIDRLATYNPRFVPVLDANQSITYKNVCLPNHWLRTMLPFLIIEGADYHIEDHVLYLDLSSYYNYGGEYTQRIMSLLELLVDAYEHGCLILDAEADAQFILDWDLKVDVRFRIFNLFAVHTPRWSNRLLAPQPTRFLDRVYQEQRVYMDIGSDLESRHVIADTLNKHNVSFCFCEERVILDDVGDIRQAHVLQDLVLSSLPPPPDLKVKIIDGESHVKYRDMVYGWVSSLVVSEH